MIGWPDAPSGLFGCGLFKLVPLERLQTEGARGIGRAYQTTLVKLQHRLLSNSDTMEAMRAVGIVCGSWGKHRSGISGSIVVLIQDLGVGIEHMNRMFDLRRSTRPKCRAVRGHSKPASKGRN